MEKELREEQSVGDEIKREDGFDKDERLASGRRRLINTIGDAGPPPPRGEAARDANAWRPMRGNEGPGASGQSRRESGLGRFQRPPGDGGMGWDENGRIGGGERKKRE